MEGAKNFSDNQRKRRRKKNSENWRNKVSFSASLPEEVSGGFADGTICLVKYSTDPFSDMRESILEMIQSVGVQDWEELEELVYCYIVLNPSEIDH
ncbi:hypothetical protein Acr_03g0007740 [Actinidia rufa]|uniref:Transcription repressor n=1 Tax=Actinidia rufa TaxID=165716 RepID=A0A7J0EC89_9ERIC|nr:hypothetical protein Acr_03g0007740 [Actinidia rufa]